MFLPFSFYDDAYTVSRDCGSRKPALAAEGSARPVLLGKHGETGLDPKHEEVGKEGFSFTKKWVIAFVARRGKGGLPVTGEIRRFLFVVGMAFFWTLPRRSYFQFMLSSWDARHLAAMNALYALFLLGLGIVAACALGAPRGRVAALVKKPFSAFACAAGMTAGGAAVYGAPFAGEAGMALAAGGSLMCGAGFAVLAFAWGRESLRLQGREMFVCSFLGFALSFVFLMASTLPAWAFVGLSLAAPLCSGLCLGGLAKTGEAGSGTASADMRAVARRAPFGLIGVLVSILLVGSVIRGLTYPATFSSSTVLDPVVINAISFVFALCLCLVVSLSSHLERSVYSLWIAVVCFFLCGLLLVAAAGPQWSTFGRGLIIVGRTYCAFFLWLVLLDAARRGVASPERLLSAFFLLPELVASAISYCILPLCAEMLSPALTGVDMSFYALLSCMLLMVASFAFLRSCMFSEGARRGGTEAPDSFSQACEALSAIYGLSAREAQVMEYVGRGLSAKVIAERLCLSASTVQTHTKNIYRKVEVHNKQELIALIARQKGG